MELHFADTEIESLYKTGNSTNKLYRKLKSNARFMCDFVKVMNILYEAENIAAIAQRATLHYEQLKYDRLGTSSVRIGYKSKYRLIFTEESNGIEITLIEINEHYGDK